MFNHTSIDEYQLEITTYCNAACPQCPRNNLGVGINPFMPLVHLSRNAIDTAFTTEHCKTLRQIFFCGSYGDPIMNPEFLDILRDFRKKNPTLWLYIHTNGGIHDVSYWAEIAAIMNGYGQIDFGIDGLEDTLHLYRKNVKYNKVIENATAFINAGGRAQWNFIVFKHNEHQVEQARELSKEYKFYNFLPRKTGRFYDHSDETEFNRWPVLNKAGEVDYYLEPPITTEFRNPSVQKIKVLKHMYGSFVTYLKQTPIKCDALLGKKVAINAEGLVLPCNFFNHNLYDARFHESALPFRHHSHNVDGKNQVQEFVNQYRDELDINKNSMEEIFKSNFWSELTKRWGQENRIMECAMVCGEKFNKVWDQGGSIR